jgi:hypothetical protein
MIDELVTNEEASGNEGHPHDILVYPSASELVHSVGQHDHYGKVETPHV